MTKSSKKTTAAKSKAAKSKKKEIETVQLHPETKRWIIIVLLFAAAGISILALFNLAGPAGGYILRLMTLIFGTLAFLVPVIFLVAGSLVMNRDRLSVRPVHIVGAIVFILALAGLVNIFVPQDQIFEVVGRGEAGGYIGLVFSYAFFNILGFWAGLIVIIALLFIGVLMMINIPLSDLADSPSLLGRAVNWVQIKWSDLRYGSLDTDEEVATAEAKVAEKEHYEEEVEEERQEKQIAFTTKALKGLAGKKIQTTSQKSDEAKEPQLDQLKKKVSYKKVDLPLDLLEESSGKPASGNVIRTKEKIQRTLESFNIPVEIGEVNVGPTVTQYELIPAEGIKLSRITALQDDLALALAAHPLRIEAPIPGKAAVGVEVPNTSVAMVRLKELISSKEFRSRDSHMQVPLGKDVTGKVWSTPLDKMPHLLVAGATGSGKSVCLNTIIVSLLYQNGPDTLRFIMVDPKKVELTLYENIPHLLTPVITDVKKTVNALKWCVAEMERRYNLLQKMGRRNIDSYNEIAEEKMPSIVFIIDELADLMVSARNDVETLIIRLAQMARAVGIHLVLATQRPSVDVITGLIKANVPTRIAFAVASVTDSRTILDSAGADKLIGKGDMLFSNPQYKRPVRIQGAFVSENEVNRVVEYLQEHGEEPTYDHSVVEKSHSVDGSVDFSDPDQGDELFEEAKDMVIQMGRASTSLLQRKLKVGYSRAARLIDLLEEAGIVGEADGSKPREILVTERDLEPDFGEGFDVAEEELQPDFDEEETEELEAITAEDEEIEEALELVENDDDEWVKS